MSTCPFCDADAAGGSVRVPPAAEKLREGKHAAGFLRRAWRGVQWGFPAVLLVLMPKCPMCVAGYVALLTGVGVSVSTAWWIRVVMLGFCFAVLGYLVVRYWWGRQTKGLRVGGSVR